MSYVLLQCLVPTASMHTTDRFLQSIKAREILFRPYQNGAADDTPKTKRQAPDGGVRDMSARQQTWLKHAIREQKTLDDLRDPWTNAGFRREGLYGALAKAVKDKEIRKVKPGVYRPVGGK